MGNKMLENIGKYSTYYNYIIVYFIDLQCKIDIILAYIRRCVPAPGTLLFFLSKSIFFSLFIGIYCFYP